MSRFPRTKWTGGVPRMFIDAGGGTFYFNWDDIDRDWVNVLTDAMIFMGYPTTMIFPYTPPLINIGKDRKSDFDEEYPATHFMVLAPGTAPIHFNREELDDEDFWIEIADQFGNELGRYYDPKDPGYYEAYGDEEWDDERTPRYVVAQGGKREFFEYRHQADRDFEEKFGRWLTSKDKKMKKPVMFYVLVDYESSNFDKPKVVYSTVVRER